MNRSRLVAFILSVLVFSLANSAPAAAQAPRSSDSKASGVNMNEDLKEFMETPGISGYENKLAETIRSKISGLHPKTDNLGDVIVTIGTGAPSRLIVTPIDEPGFVVSGITDDGYLRVQRLPQGGLPPIFNELYSAQPVKIETTPGKWIDGVVAGLSVHLQGGRANPPKSSDLENVYIDIGATSVAQVRKSGVDILSPVAIDREAGSLGYGKMAGASIGDRFGAAAVVDLLQGIDPSKVKGTLTIAFVVQQWTGARGLQRVLSTMKPDEMIYVGRLFPGGPVAGMEGVRRAPRREPGSGVLIGMEETNGTLAGLTADLKQLADSNKIQIDTDFSASLLPRSYLAGPPMPAKWAHLGIATDWPNTPAELIDFSDLANLENLLQLYVQGSVAVPREAAGSSPTKEGMKIDHPSNVEILRILIPSYGVSNHEGPVREDVKKLLPTWAKPETDEAGNLVLQVGTAAGGSKSPRILVVAHMDEIGFEVKSISKDGRLEVVWRGGGELSFFAGHPALVHSDGGDKDAIVELPNGWDEPKFEWPRGPENAIRVDVGARTPEEVEKLGIKIGDSITIPKAYRPLLGTRANGRAFDDRVGDAALISAVWALAGPLKDRDVTFVWSTGEEEGLLGAAAVAKRLAAQGHIPDYVFAVDTFVSSDSPIESKRYADAEIGKGFVIRAVDSSNIIPSDLVEKTIKLAHANQIPVQYGVTGGGNDGSAFVRYGSVDIALGWPLRYSHSPAEVIDTRDVDSLARIITVIAKAW
ncbi:MAG TPA: M20/M25/M40 family metallo-hydrolase [Candidatus Acidoferrales bacterium]|nr:M20/M25/M40 family metallo-hydrolase [Candidatus Acidoferrales bacterium]